IEATCHQRLDVSLHEDQFGAEVAVLHVVHPTTVTVEVGYLPPELAISQQETKDAVRQELQKLCERAVGTEGRFQVQVREGVPWEEVTAAARESNVDLIILATHGRTGLKHVLLGSVTERVVRHAPCPVLVVREHERDFMPVAGGRDESARESLACGG
ncbi:MAG TPA: universal stress protein, partial [Verrucomicrobiota bacterium]|nr:universal stress protein [Verrucomicrobiota bacterium]